MNGLFLVVVVLQVTKTNNLLEILRKKIMCRMDDKKKISKIKGKEYYYIARTHNDNNNKTHAILHFQYGWTFS